MNGALDAMLLNRIIDLVPEFGQRIMANTTTDTSYTPSRFLEQAFASAAAADAYSARAPIVNTMTLNFLMGRAIELAIKAYLLSKGTSMDVLRGRKSFGHDLEAGLVLALEKGFNTEGDYNAHRPGSYRRIERALLREGFRVSAKISNERL